MKENCMTAYFNAFGLSNALQDSLAAMNFETPTPIQAVAIPFGLMGRDILGSAQTGTGKTAAFCIPMIDYLLRNTNAHALVMLPTRELASQVHDVARKMIGEKAKGPEGIKTALLIGGEAIGKQYVQLNRRPRLIVGTPGRINDHLRGNADLVDRVSFVVLDEADRMLDMGFAGQIDTILSETAQPRQTLMFSATFPDSIVKFSKKYLNEPERISVGAQSKPGENIIQESLNVPQEKKYEELRAQLAKREGSVIIFARTQHSADKLAGKLVKDGYAADALHGGLRQRQRDKVTASFRKGAIRILVATDVAARGLDVPHIEHVINHDLPQVAEDYIHRIGRTARAGNEGHAVSFVSPGERHLWREIQKMLDPNGDYESGLRDEKTVKKSGGKKGYGAKDGYKGREKDGARKAKGGYGPRKPFGRADRKERKENGWDPANDFQRADKSAADGNFKKPHQKREDKFASNPDAWKRTNSAERKEGGFKKPWNRDKADGAQRQYKGDRPFRKEGNGEGRSYAPRAGGFNDRYRKQGDGNRTEGGFKKPFVAKGESRPGGNRNGAEKRLRQKKNGASGR